VGPEFPFVHQTVVAQCQQENRHHPPTRCGTCTSLSVCSRDNDVFADTVNIDAIRQWRRSG
jgi:hypothetical protein